MNLTPEMIRAAEYVSEGKAWQVVRPYGPDRHDIGNEWFQEQAKILATAILTNRSDFGPDGEPLPVDDGWLKAIGGDWNERLHAFVFVVTGHERLCVRSNGQWWLDSTSLNGGTAGGKRHVRYRHQVRQLADVVGVTLLASLGGGAA